MMRNQDLTLANIQNIPGGFQRLTSLFNSMNSVSIAGSDPSTEEANMLMASRLGVSPTLSTDSPNSQALPNPWATPRASPMSALPFGNFGPFGMGFPPSSNSAQNTSMPNQTINTASPTSAMNSSQNFPPFFPITPMGMNPFLMPGVPNAAASPVSGAQNPFLMMQQLMQSTPMNAPPPVSEPVEIRYREQLQTLREMGFTNEEQNKRAILAAVFLLDLGW
jgi:ubiquilin